MTHQQDEVPEKNAAHLLKRAAFSISSSTELTDNASGLALT
jgi:hypothetical protein